MPDHDAVQNAPHLHARRGATGGPLRPEPGLAEDLAARRLAAHIAEGDLGTVRRAVCEFEHETGPWRPDPWRLLEATASRLLEDDPGEPQTASCADLAAT